MESFQYFFTFIVTVNDNDDIAQANREATASLNWLRNDRRAPDDKFMPRHIP
jgi:hypothetical protein